MIVGQPVDESKQTPCGVRATARGFCGCWNSDFFYRNGIGMVLLTRLTAEVEHLNGGDATV